MVRSTRLATYGCLSILLFLLDFEENLANFKCNGSIHWAPNNGGYQLWPLVWWDSSKHRPQHYHGAVGLPYAPHNTKSQEKQCGRRQSAKTMAKYDYGGRSSRPFVGGKMIRIGCNATTDQCGDDRHHTTKKNCSKNKVGEHRRRISGQLTTQTAKSNHGGHPSQSLVGGEADTHQPWWKWGEMEGKQLSK